MKRSLLLVAVTFIFLTSCVDDNGSGGNVAPASGTVVYLADQDIAGVFELFLASSGAKLNPTLPVGRTVVSFALTPNGSAVVYLADQDQDDVFAYTINSTSGALAAVSGSPFPAGVTPRAIATPRRP